MPVSRVMVCIPVNPDEVDELLGSGQWHHPRQAFSPNAALQTSFEVIDQEEAEYAALLVASLWCLTHQMMPLVLVAQVPPSVVTPGVETANGGIQLDRLVAGQVESFFAAADESPVANLQARLANLDLDQAWEDEDFQRLILEQPMLWHDISEWSQFSK